MAQWKETLEPYIRVQERVKSLPLNPTAGEDLIVGVAIISDAGPSTPTLVRSQPEFRKMFSSKDITQDYISSLNSLYTGADKTLAATMWSNAYRLAGSTNLLVVRATKAKDLNFAKPLTKGDLNTYLLRDGSLMKKVDSFKIVLDTSADSATAASDGWSMCVSGIGIFGNRTTDHGPQYDYFVNSLPDLVEQLNNTPKFFSPDYTFYSDVKGQVPVNIDSASSLADKMSVKMVKFGEVYLGENVLDLTDPRTGNKGVAYLIPCQPDWEDTNPTQKVIELNSTAWSGFTASPWFATNVYNSATTLRVRIRRFNHDAVTIKQLDDAKLGSLTESGESPYVVLGNVLSSYLKKGKPGKSVIDRDFYEVAVWDPSVNDKVSFFNVGKVLGRGDMEVSEINSLLQMINLSLPDNLEDLGLNYYGYEDDDFTWVPVESVGGSSATQYGSEEEMRKAKATEGAFATVSGTNHFKYTKTGETQIFADLTIDPSKYKILSVSDTDLKNALDLISLDEVYTVEGLCDLGNTELSFQNYMSGMAINENYFYPISTVNSTNYMTIGNSATKISANSYKLYMSSPWDIDTGTLGWKYYASPSVLYWEAVSRNRRNNEEFRGILGQTGGIVQYQKPVTEFNKKTRQLLLSRRVNTVLWNTSTQAWNMNDNYTKQNEDTIMSDEGNSRLMIRISKAIPTLLRQYIGRKISEVLCSDVVSTIEYFFKKKITPMAYTVDAYQVFCDYDEDLARQNKIKVVINVRYARSLKFIEVYNNAFDVGMDISASE